LQPSPHFPHLPKTYSGRAIEEIEESTGRDNFMSSDKAKTSGLVDNVVVSRKEIPGAMEKTSLLT
jgi:ATP-dependent protease ClpP protease subunit